MKKIYILTLFLISQISLFAQTVGDMIDPTFGDNSGFFEWEINEDIEGAALQGMKVGTDNKIIFFGQKNAGDHNVLVGRLNIDGSPDTSFATDGYGVYDFTLGGHEGMRDMHIMPDGKIILAGQYSTIGFADFLISRILPDGNVDNSFGTNGSTTIPTAYFMTGQRVRVDNNGKIVVAGYFVQNGLGVIMILRFNDNGTLDNSFSGDGRLDLYNNVAGGSNNYSEEVIDMEIGPNNSIYIIPKDYEGDETGIIYKITSTGAWDNTFGGDGKVELLPPVGRGFYLKDLLVNFEGRVWVSGENFQDGQDGLGSLMVVKLNPDGTNDQTYGLQGMAKYTPPINFGVTGLFMQRQGNSIIVGGDHINSNTQECKAFAVKFTDSGALDQSYGSQGFFKFQLETDCAIAYTQSLAMQSGGRLVFGALGLCPANKYSAVFARLDHPLGAAISEAETSTVSLYPNPTADYFQINITDGSTLEQVSLLDMTGKVITTWIGNQNYFQLPYNLAKGNYWVKINSSTGISHKTIMVNKQ